MYSKIKTGKIEKGKNQMVFVILYAEDGTPYEKYLETAEQNRNIKIPICLMQLRWDGYIGFPGGKVDKGETLLEAIQREVEEEVGYWMDQEEFIPFLTFSNDISNIHSFICKVDIETLKLIQSDGAPKCAHFLAENCGCILPHLMEYAHKKGISQFLNNNFIATAKMELQEFIKYIGI